MKARIRNPGILYVRHVPPVLKAMFKSELAKRGLLIEEVIPALIEKYLQDPSLFPVRKKGIQPWEQPI